MALAVVSDYVAYARILLQDQVTSGGNALRYPDSDLVLALNSAFSEAARIRPDLFIGQTLPTFANNDNTPVPLDPMYSMPFVYYMCGMAQLRDDEEVQDQRAAAFLQLFNAKLLTVA